MVNGTTGMVRINIVNEKDLSGMMSEPLCQRFLKDKRLVIDNRELWSKDNDIPVIQSFGSTSAFHRFVKCRSKSKLDKLKKELNFY